MGLKSGPADTGIDDGEQDHDQDTDTVESDNNSISYDDLPYLLRRDSVNSDRKQISFFIRESILSEEDEHEAKLEEMLGEEVYRSDVREAAIVVAMENPVMITSKLREWGYDLD